MTETDAPRSRPLVEFQSVSRTFDPDELAGLHDVSFQIWPGEFVSIVGPSGAGKSTLLNILGLLDGPTSGRYLFEGLDTAGFREADRDRLRAQKLGFVFQSSFVLTGDTALENAALGLRVQGIPIIPRTQRAARALQSLGILGRGSTPAGLLSGGERQRLALARAIATEPILVLADEPTGNLDSKSARTVVDHLLELNECGTTVVMITHDRSIAAVASRQIEIVDGRARELSRGHLVPLAAPTGSLQDVSEIKARHRITSAALDDFGEALTAISRRLTRSTLLVMAFALGIAGMIMALGLSESAASQVSQRLTTAALDEVRINLAGGNALLQPDDTRLERWTSTIANLPHVESVSYVASVGASSAQVRRLGPDGPQPTAEFFVMTSSAEYLVVSEADLTNAPNIHLIDNSSITSVAWIGDITRRELSIASPGPGSALWIGGQRVDVLGEFRAGDRVEYLGRAIFVSKDVVAAIPGASVSIVVRTEPGFPATVADAIPVALDPSNPGQFSIETVADLRNLRFGVSNDLGTFVGALALILLVLATVSASTTMYLSVLARTPEIALRRAIGTRRAAIARLFLAEGMIVGLLGGAIGCFSGTLAAIVGATAQGWTPVLVPYLPPLALAIGVATGLMSAVVPAVSASRLNPATAIRG